MTNEKSERKAVYLPPILPRGPERREERRRWPSPTPLPVFQPEGIGRIPKQVLDRLDAIEKRVENIEKLLTEKRTV